MPKRFEIAVMIFDRVDFQDPYSCPECRYHTIMAESAGVALSLIRPIYFGLFEKYQFQVKELADGELGVQEKMRDFIDNSEKYMAGR